MNENKSVTVSKQHAAGNNNIIAGAISVVVWRSRRQQSLRYGAFAEGAAVLQFVVKTNISPATTNSQSRHASISYFAIKFGYQTPLGGCVENYLDDSKYH